MNLDFDGNSSVEFVGEIGAVITRSATKNKKALIGDLIDIDVTNGDRAKIMGWGADNDLPIHRERIVAENNIVPTLISTRRDITLGQGLFAYRNIERDGKIEVEEVAMPPEQADFFAQLEEDEYWLTALRNDAFHSAIATEFLRGDGLNNKIVSMKALEMRHLRSEEMDELGQVQNWYWSGNWGHKRDKSVTKTFAARRIPLYNPELEQKKFLYLSMDNLLCMDEYYPTPFWWGSEEWIRLANCIPEFHQANLKNGYTLRWHVEIPKGYFMNSTSKELVPSAVEDAVTKANQAKQQFLDQLKKTLQGMENAGKTIVSEFEINKSIGKEYSGIKITPLNVDMKDEALLTLFEKGNQAVISSQGVHPTLANIETAGKLSSGTEIRNAYLMYLAIKTAWPRKRALRPIKLVKKINGWDPEIHHGFKDMTLEALSDDKSGKGEKKEPVQ